MADVRPFKAIRPTRDKAHLVGSRSYISYTDEALTEKLKGNPFSFLHIINPDFGDSKKKIRSADGKYIRVREKYEEFVQEGFFFQEKQDTFYIYRQIKGENSYTGLIGGISVEDYKNGHVKIHEHTITKREEMFKNYLRDTRINAEPVLLSYPNHPEITELISKYTQQRAEYEFATTDTVVHYFWLVNSPEDIAAMQKAFAEVEDFYIADGHHRSASSALLCDELNKEITDTNAPHRHFMALMLAEDQIHIYDFNRLVKDLNGITKDSFLKQLEEQFEVLPKGEIELYRPTEYHEISMYLDHEWYSLKMLSGTFEEGHPTGSLDCQILSENILDPILGVKDLKTDQRIGFAGGPEGIEQMKASVDCGKYRVGFGLYPVTIDQLKTVADNHLIMPPKSTWVEPKLRSGLTIYPLFED